MAGSSNRAAAAPGGSVLRRHIAAQAALRKPAAAGDQPAPPVPAARTPERAIASAIARAADRAHEMPVFFDQVTTGHAVVAELGDLFPDHALIAVVEAPGDRLGAVAICPGLLTSLIEMQALGRISSRPAAPRRPTRTDGAISAEFVNAALAELGAELAHQPGFEGVQGYRYASFLDDPRPLELMLEDVTYRLIRVSLRAGPAGQRDGQIIVLLPVTQVVESGPVLSVAMDSPAVPVKAATTDRPGVLADSVGEVPIEVVGILCRRMISLGELQALTPGDSITLPPGALGMATLETAAGQRLAQGRLGSLAGRNALRIAGPVGATLHDSNAGAAATGHAAGPGGIGSDGIDPAAMADASAPFGGFGGMAPSLDDAATVSPDLSGSAGLPSLDFEPPMADLTQADPFREAAPEAESADPGLDLSAWEDEPAAPLAPLEIQIG